MADNKLIFQFKWLNWIFHRWFLDWSQLFCRLAFRSRNPADGKCSFFLPVHSPVLLTPGASSQLDVTQNSLRYHVSIKSFPLLPMVSYLPLLQRGRERLFEYVMRTALRHRGRGPMTVWFVWIFSVSRQDETNGSSGYSNFNPTAQLYQKVNSPTYCYIRY